MSIVSRQLQERHLIVLPLCAAFEDWLDPHYFSVFKDAILPAYFQWGDIGSNDVLCTVQLSVILVRGLLLIVELY